MNLNVKWTKTDFYSFCKEEHVKETLDELLLSTGERM